MDQLSDFADDRLVNGCLYCGSTAETRDHVPSRTFLERPFPENLPVVGACKACNQSFSMDEEYLACLIEVVLTGSTDPEQMKRSSAANALRRSPSLRSRIEAAKQNIRGRTVYVPESDRVKNVLLKLARGHAGFELSQPCRTEPDHFWAGPMELMAEDVRAAFNSAHEQKLFGEIGSRGLQRLMVMEMKMRSEAGEEHIVRRLLNNWVDVQDGRYRYQAIDDIGGVVIRIVIAEYLACEVAWKSQ